MGGRETNVYSFGAILIHNLYGHQMLLTVHNRWPWIEQVHNMPDLMCIRTHSHTAAALSLLSLWQTSLIPQCPCHAKLSWHHILCSGEPGLNTHSASDMVLSVVYIFVVMLLQNYKM